MWSRPAGRGLALGLGAGQRGGLAGERGHAALEPALGEEQHAADGEDQDQAPEEHGRAVDHDGALGGDQAAGGTVAERGAGRAATRQVPTSAADQAGEGEHDLGQVAALAGQERLDEHAEAGDAEDDEQRPQLGVLDVRLDEAPVGRRPDEHARHGEVHCWPSCAESSPAAGTTGASSLTPDVLQQGVDGGVADVEQRHREEAEEHEREHERGDEPISRRSRSAGVLVPGAPGPVMVRWYIHST